eukprot:Pgem_evm1s17134
MSAFCNKKKLSVKNAANNHNKNYNLDRAKLETNGFFHLLWVLLMRNFVSANRDAHFINMRTTKNVFLAFVFLSIYYNVNSTNVFPSYNSIAFIFVIVSTFGMNGIGYVSSMLSDREIFYRERQA